MKTILPILVLVALSLVEPSPVRAKNAAPLPKADIVVAANGSGDFKTVQEAVASIPSTNTERIVVLVKAGTYKEKVRVDAPFVTLRGESRTGTRLEFPQLNDDFNKSPDELGRAVLNVNGDDFVMENLTVENTAGVIGPHAFTIYGKGDRTVIVNCDVLSHGADTVSLWLGERGRYYHARCNFRGSVDFVCPRGWCYVTDCTFYEMKPGSAAVWHDGSKDKDMKFVLRDCKFDGTNGWVMARHHLDAQFYFLDCRFSATMADKAPLRVIYPLDGGTATEADTRKNLDNDKRNQWGERCYFWNSSREGGNPTWMTNNLSSSPGSPKPETVTAAWTFVGKWNPERTVGPTIQKVSARDGTITLQFSESVTVKGRPRLMLEDGKVADYVSGSGRCTLQFASDSKTGEPATFDLNDGAIIATEADASMVHADLKLP
jgi:pectinesterase